MTRIAGLLPALALLAACGGGQSTETTPDGTTEESTVETQTTDETAGAETAQTAPAGGACSARPQLDDEARRPTDLPAVDEAGQRFVLLDRMPVPYTTSTPDVYVAPRVVWLDAANGELQRAEAIRTPEEIDPANFIDMSCCDGVEEGCDPFLCEPGEAEEQAAAELGALAMQRVRTLNAELATGTYCALEPLPESAVLVNPRESWGERFMVALSPTQLPEEFAIQIPAREGADESGELVHEVSAWFDPRGRRLLLRIAFVDSDNESARVVFRVLQP